MFISSRPHVRAKQIKEMNRLRRRETLASVFYTAKLIMGVSLFLVGSWAFIWLCYFATM